MARGSFDLDKGGKQSGESKKAGGGEDPKKKMILIGVAVLCFAGAGAAWFYTNRPEPVKPEELAAPPVEMTPEQEKETKRVLELQQRQNKNRPPAGS
jgi:hypothetical protein